MATLRLPRPRTARAQVQEALDFGGFAAAAGAKRPKAKRVRIDPSEGQAQAAVLQLLAHHPRVAFAGRFNRGAFVREGKDGKRNFYRMNTVEGFSDIHGMFIGGLAFYIEMKRAGEPPTPEQQGFLDLIKRHGGLAIVGYSADQVYEEIKAFFAERRAYS